MPTDPHAVDLMSSHKNSPTNEKGCSSKTLVASSLDQRVGEPREELGATTHCVGNCGDSGDGRAFSELGQIQRCSGAEGSVESRTGEKRRQTKTIGLAVLRQHFAETLKDAAKSIGVSPTTLKRICRQHGIARWPSRKIKKVGHSLRKLQLVIDSVQSADGAVQNVPFQLSFPQLGSPQNHQQNDDRHFSPVRQSNVPNRSHSQHQNGFIRNDSSMKPQSSSSRQALGPTDISQSHATFSNQNRVLETLPPSSDSRERNSVDGFAFGIKANFGDKKIRFRVLPECSFQDLKAEIARRFNLDDLSTIDIKYLDDDREWVLLTCSADLQESFELHRRSQNRTVRLCLQQAS